MKVLKYVVKEENIRNVEGDKEVIKKFIAGKDPKNHIFEIDFLNIADPKVTMSTGITFQNIANVGFKKIIVINHKYKDQLEINPVIKILISKGIIEIR